MIPVRHTLKFSRIKRSLVNIVMIMTSVFKYRNPYKTRYNYREYASIRHTIYVNYLTNIVCMCMCNIHIMREK